MYEVSVSSSEEELLGMEPENTPLPMWPPDGKEPEGPIVGGVYDEGTGRDSDPYIVLSLTENGEVSEKLYLREVPGCITNFVPIDTSDMVQGDRTLELYRVRVEMEHLEENGSMDTRYNPGDP